ncbi:MAG TPA: type II CRISPR RNA-guided endonuclease Cas9 [Pirellulales bacterium]|nr:type II CRISPR RNA-guided endonuclease Cas9 [Pirellulales bacterium]
MSGPTLGLDIGANSIGWALIDEQNSRLIDAGVRIFPEGVDKFDTKKETSKSESRRVARGMRRQIARRSSRKRNLRQALASVGLHPSDAEEQAHIDSLDPYQLRRRGLDEALTPHEFGRVLLHLNQRRGFLSNRKSDRERKKETQGMLAEINDLQREIEESGSRTVGEYFARLLQQDPLAPVRGRHTRRDMFEHEFNLLWQEQRKHHPELLTDHLRYGTLGPQDPSRHGVRLPEPLSDGQTPVDRYGVESLVFFQRPMYWPRSVVGACELEPNRKRCPRADRLAQRFRLLQEVNNLRYIDPATGDEAPLSKQHRTLLLDKLSKTKEMTFDQIRKALGFLEAIPFNLEAGKRTKLQGMVTDAVLADKKLFGPAWHKRPDAEKTQLVRCLIQGEESEIRHRARGEWGLNAEATQRLLDVDLPAGYIRLSIAALERLVPHMERGLLYMTADGTPSALSEAGYLRRDQQRRHVLDRLPEPPDVANPVVRQALFELRKVVNSIIKSYGPPGRVHIELARNATATAEQRRKMSQNMREREAQRDEAAEKIREHGVKVTREAIDRYLLWQEQAEVCVYSGLPISIAQLFGGEVHIDHILPRSRTLDDSFANKVVCFVKHNAGKKNLTPYEWLAAGDPERFEQVQQRVAKLPYNKRRRFTVKELDLSDFIERQLNDTRYINRVAHEYLQCLAEEPHHVLCPKGNHTETLRWLWGLNTILREDSLNKKNRTDHRHHAIDAIVIALTDQRRLQALAAINRDELTSGIAARLAAPWEKFRADVEQRMQTMNVSHRPSRKVAGALHEDTFYGPTNVAGEFAVRKPLEALTPSMIADIRDPAIRELVLERLRKFRVSLDRGAKQIPAEVWKETLKMHSGVPVKKVRILRREKTIQPIREGRTYVKPGSTHHVCLFEWAENAKSVRGAVFVTMLEATNRLKRREPIIQRTHPERPEAKFLMSLSSGEMVLLEHNGVEALYTFETARSTTWQMEFRLHTAGGTSSDKSGVATKYPSTFEGRKVTVTPLGQLRWASD